MLAVTTALILSKEYLCPNKVTEHSIFSYFLIYNPYTPAFTSPQATK